ncbi:MAG: membrane lipoprotein lipid attachment site-containing protein [Candidatus Nanoarchaeia archaeon]|nr:membrane lipoprotein lipid attachment site-containing protein [Candidatus Nanoarchaeia archaeon]
MKKLIFTLSLLILLAGCTNSSQIETNNSSESGNIESVGTNSNSVTQLTERDRYIEANIELTCLSSGPNAIVYSEENEIVFDTIAAKYGFTMSEIDSLYSKYENDATAQLEIVNGMMELCPEII